MLEARHPLTDREELRPVPASAAVLAVSNLAKQFHTRGLRGAQPVKAVDDVSFTLRAGNTTGLVGESGSGKSTVARMVAQLMRPTSGVIALDGVPVSVRNSSELRQYCAKVQLVLQDPYASLNPSHTVRHHLERALKLHHKVPRYGNVDEQICELLARVSLVPGERYLGKYPHELSGGERQRVSIARSLAPGPRVLIADEPVSMLDVSIRLDVLKLIERLKGEDDLAVLYITHDLLTAREFTQDMLVMHRGRVVERGESREIISNPRHEYTRALLAAIPNPSRARQAPQSPRGAKT